MSQGRVAPLRSENPEQDHDRSRSHRALKRRLLPRGHQIAAKASMSNRIAKASNECICACTCQHIVAREMPLQRFKQLAEFTILNEALELISASPSLIGIKE